MTTEHFTNVDQALSCLANRWYDIRNEILSDVMTRPNASDPSMISIARSLETPPIPPDIKSETTREANQWYYKIGKAMADLKDIADEIGFVITDEFTPSVKVAIATLREANRKVFADTGLNEGDPIIIDPVPEGMATSDATIIDPNFTDPATGEQGVTVQFSDDPDVVYIVEPGSIKKKVSAAIGGLREAIGKYAVAIREILQTATDEAYTTQTQAENIGEEIQSRVLEQEGRDYEKLQAILEQIMDDLPYVNDDALPGIFQKIQEDVMAHMGAFEDMIGKERRDVENAMEKGAALRMAARPYFDHFEIRRESIHDDPTMERLQITAHITTSIGDPSDEKYVWNQMSSLGSRVPVESTNEELGDVIDSELANLKQSLQAFNVDISKWQHATDKLKGEGDFGPGGSANPQPEDFFGPSAREAMADPQSYARKILDEFGGDRRQAEIKASELLSNTETGSNAEKIWLQVLRIIRGASKTAAAEEHDFQSGPLQIIVRADAMEWAGIVNVNGKEIVEYTTKDLYSLIDRLRYYLEFQMEDDTQDPAFENIAPSDINSVDADLGQLLQDKGHMGGVRSIVYEDDPASEHDGGSMDTGVIAGKPLMQVFAEQDTIDDIREDVIRRQAAFEQITDDMAEIQSAPQPVELKLVIDLRQRLKEELDAISKYDAMVALLSSRPDLEYVLKIVDHIGNEEKEHLSELQEMLRTLDPEQADADAGMPEAVADVVSEANPMNETMKQMVASALEIDPAHIDAWHESAPAYAIAKRERGASLQREAIIRKTPGKEEWCVKSKDGSKNLGCYDSKKGAEERLRAVEYFKRQGGAIDGEHRDNIMSDIVGAFQQHIQDICRNSESVEEALLTAFNEMDYYFDKRDIQRSLLQEWKLQRGMGVTKTKNQDEITDEISDIVLKATTFDEAVALALEMLGDRDDPDVIKEIVIREWDKRKTLNSATSEIELETEAEDTPDVLVINAHALSPEFQEHVRDIVLESKSIQDALKAAYQELRPPFASDEIRRAVSLEWLQQTDPTLASREITATIKRRGQNEPLCNHPVIIATDTPAERVVADMVQKRLPKASVMVLHGDEFPDLREADQVVVIGALEKRHHECVMDLVASGIGVQEIASDVIPATAEWMYGNESEIAVA